jgi:TRAP-type transport system small permease protein
MSRRAAALRLLDGVDRAAITVIVAAMGAMVFVVSLQVLLRYAFNTSLDWAEDIARLTFVWAIFLAIPLGVRGGAHIGIELLTNHLPAPAQRACIRGSALLCAGLMTVVGYYSTLLVIQQWDEMLPTLEITAALFMVPVAFGAAHSVLHLLAIAISGTAPRAQGMIE